MLIGLRKNQLATNDQPTLSVHQQPDYLNWMVNVMYQPSLKLSSFNHAFLATWEEMFVHLINLLEIICITQELLNFLFGHFVFNR